MASTATLPRGPTDDGAVWKPRFSAGGKSSTGLNRLELAQGPVGD